MPQTEHTEQEQQKLEAFLETLPSTTDTEITTIIDTTTTGRKGSFEQVKDLPLSSIMFDPDQPRKEFSAQTVKDLGASIEVNGMLQWPSVRETEQDDQYIVLFGEMRIRAVRHLGWDEVRVRVYPSSYVFTETDRLVRQVAENYARTDLTPAEVIQAFDRLEELDEDLRQSSMDFGMSQSHYYTYDRVRRHPFAKEQVLKGEWALTRAYNFVKAEDDKAKAMRQQLAEEEAEEEKRLAAEAEQQQKIDGTDGSEDSASDGHAPEEADTEIQEGDEPDTDQRSEDQAGDTSPEAHETATEQNAAPVSRPPSSTPVAGAQDIVAATEALIRTLKSASKSDRHESEKVIFRNSGVVTCADWTARMFDDATDAEKDKVRERLAKIINQAA